MKPTDNRMDLTGQIDDLLLGRSSQILSEQELSGKDLSDLNTLLERITDRSTKDFGRANDSGNLAVSFDSPEPELGQTFASLGVLLSEVVPEKPFCWKGPISEDLSSEDLSSAEGDLTAVSPIASVSPKSRQFTANRLRALVSALAVLFLAVGWSVWRQHESNILFPETDTSIMVGANNSPSVDELLAVSDGLDAEGQDMADWDQDLQDSYWGDSFEEQLDSIEFVMTGVQSAGDSDSLYKQAYWDGIDFQVMDEF